MPSAAPSMQSDIGAGNATSRRPSTPFLQISQPTRSRNKCAPIKGPPMLSSTNPPGGGGSHTDLGRKVLGQIIPPLAEYIASKQRPPPQGLETVVRQVPHDELALIAVASLLNKIDTDWDREDKSARLKIVVALGNDLRDQLEMRRLLEECPAAHTYVMHAKSRQRAIWNFRRLDWSEPDLARAGDWLLDCA